MKYFILKMFEWLIRIKKSYFSEFRNNKYFVLYSKIEFQRYNNNIIR